jgi:CRISPR-associated protein (TIGR03984 family)
MADPKLGSDPIGEAEITTGSGGATETVAWFAQNRPSAIGWLLSPTAAWWVELSQNHLQMVSGSDGPKARDGGGEIVALDRVPDDVFELRLFTPADELRWTFDSDLGQGRWRLVDDTSAAVRRLTPWPGPTPRHLLWGRIAQTGDWTRLADARVGSLWVPLVTTEPDASQLVGLTTVEYVSQDEHGNLAVADQRHTGLTVIHATDITIKSQLSPSVPRQPAQETKP